MTTKELINQYVTAHADNRWMDASELETLLTEFAEKLKEPASNLTWQDMKRIVEISDEIIEKTPMEELNNNGERWFYEEVLRRYKANENGVIV